MSGAHRLPRRRRLPRRIIPVGIALAVALAVAVPGVALALFSSSPSGQTAPVTAATIGAPTNFQATATGSSTATLSWTAPLALTGYTLSQSPGTLAGCSATPTASTTSCTATGLSPGTNYTWTLTGVYHTWQGGSAQAASTTFKVVGAALLAHATDVTPGTLSSTVSGVSTTGGATLLILVYRQASNGNIAINSISGTAISGSPAAVNSQLIDGKFEIFAWKATGSGTASGTVTVNFNTGSNPGTNVSTSIDVVQLSGNNTGSPIAGSAVSTGNSTTATGAMLSPGSSSDGEVFFTGLIASETMGTPSGYTALDAPAAPATAAYGSWFNSSASASGVTAGLGGKVQWGTIEVEISHA